MHTLLIQNNVRLRRQDAASFFTGCAPSSSRLKRRKSWRTTRSRMVARKPVSSSTVIMELTMENQWTCAQASRSAGRPTGQEAKHRQARRGRRTSRCCGRNWTRRYFSMRRAKGVSVGVHTTV